MSLLFANFVAYSLESLDFLGLLDFLVSLVFLVFLGFLVSLGLLVSLEKNLFYYDYAAIGASR